MRGEAYNGTGTGLEKGSVGTLILTGASTYTGNTKISGGTLSVGSIGTTASTSSNIGAGSSTLEFNGGTLLYTGASAVSDRAFTIIAGKTATINTTNDLTLAGATGTATTGALTKTGLGTLTLTGANTNTGITTVNGGTLLLDKTGAGALAATSALTLGGGTFQVKGAASGVTTQTMGALTLNVGRTNRIVLDSNGGTSNTLTLPNSSPTRVGGVTLLIDLSSPNTTLTSTLGLAAGAQATTAAVLGYAAVKDSGGVGFATNVSGNIVRYTGADTLLSSSNSSTTNFKHAPTGSGNTLTTTNNAAFNSLSIDTSGASGNNILALTGTVTLAQRGILMTGNNDFTIQGGTSLGGSGHETIIHNYGTGTLFINSPIVTLAAAVSKDGPGTVVMGSATSNFQNNFRINEGILRLGSAGGATNGPLGTTGAPTIVQIGGALDLGGFTLGTAEGLQLNGTGVSGGGALINSGGAASYSGLLSLASNASIVANNNITLSNVGTITGAGFGLTVGGSANTSIASIIGTGSGSLTKTGAGTLTLTGANTYTGTTTVSTGTLLVSGSISGSTTTVNGGTLGGSGGTTGAVTVATGGTIAPGSSVGTLNTGTLTFTGGAFGLEINTSAITSDLANVSGDLNLLGGGTLSITDFSVSGTPLSIGQVFTFIDYSGVWDGGVFTGRADDSDFTLGLNTYRISYNGVDNATTAVTLEVVPEPGSAVLLLGGLAALAGFRRRRE